MVERVQEAFTENDREFLLSIKRGTPKWELIDLPGIDTLPAVRWKLQNLEMLNSTKRDQLLIRLESALKGNRTV